MGDKAEKREKKKVVDVPKKSTEPPDKLAKNQIVMGESHTPYVVESVLGKGGFGEVYKVHPHAEPEQNYAMKVEDNNAADPNNKKMLRLKVEILVFETIESARDLGTINTDHFVNMLDKGKTEAFKWYVMDVIWLSLKEVKILFNNIFSPNTIMQIARQTLRSIQSLHEIGFLHRDIKPANFAVGLAPRDNVVYLLDFGICRPFRGKDGKVMVARKNVPFMGTVKYASLRSHEQQEQARRDDLEVWAYMMIELYDKKNLIWSHLNKGIEIQLKKKELLVNTRALHGDGKLKMPIWYCDIISSIFKMKYDDVGDYRFINQMFANIVRDGNIDESKPLDWAGKAPKGPPIKPRKKKEPKKEIRKKESSKSHKKSVMGGPPTIDDQQKALLQKEKRRRRKERQREEEEMRIEMDDEQNSDEDDSEDEEDEEDYRGGGGRRRKKSRNKRSRQRTRTYDEDFSDRDERDDDRDERRRRSRSNGGRKKKSAMSRVSQKTRDDYRDEDRVARIPEPDNYREDKYMEKRGGDEDDDRVKTPEKRSDPRDDKDAKKSGKPSESRMEPPPPDDGAYMVLGDINNKESYQNAQDKKAKEKKDGEAKKDQASPATKMLDVKKAAEAATVKKDAVDPKKK